MFEELERKRSLKDIHVEEVSLVGNPANNKRFFFFKQEIFKMDKELKEAIEEFTGEELTDEKLEEISKAALKPKALTELKAALKILNQYKSDLPDDLADAISSLAKFLASATKTSYGYPAKKGNENIMADKEKDIRKTVEEAITAMEESQTAAKEKIRELLPENVKKDIEEDEKWNTLLEGIKEVKNRLTALEASTAEVDLESDNEDASEEEDEPITDVMKSLAAAIAKNDAQIKKLRKTAAPKKSNDEEIDLQKDEEDLWKSIKL